MVKKRATGSASGKLSKVNIKPMSVEELLSTDELPAAKIAEAASKARLKIPVNAAYLAGQPVSAGGGVTVEPLPAGWVAMQVRLDTDQLAGAMDERNPNALRPCIFNWSFLSAARIAPYSLGPPFVQDEEGDVFYYCAATATAQWDRPTAAVAVKTAAPVPAPAPAAASKVSTAAATVRGGSAGVAGRGGTSTAAGGSTPGAGAAASRTGPTSSVGAAAGKVTASASTAKAAASPAPAPAAAAAAPAPAPAAAAAPAGDMDGCDTWEANPFKKNLCKHCRKAESAHRK